MTATVSMSAPAFGGTAAPDAVGALIEPVANVSSIAPSHSSTTKPTGPSLVTDGAMDRALARPQTPPAASAVGTPRTVAHRQRPTLSP